MTQTESEEEIPSLPARLSLVLAWGVVGIHLVYGYLNITGGEWPARAFYCFAPLALFLPILAFYYVVHGPAKSAADKEVMNIIQDDIFGKLLLGPTIGFVGITKFLHWLNT